jgi:hypothetical protein
MTPIDVPLIAEIPVPYRRNGVRWLVVQKQVDGSWLLLGHRTLDEGSEFDSWHATRDGAVREAEMIWGVSSAGWRPDLRVVE